MLHVAEGDTLEPTEMKNGFNLAVGEPEFAKTMDGFESLNRRYCNALHTLAKK